MHWSFFLHERPDHDGGKQFLTNGCKKYREVGWLWSENHVYLFKAYVIKNILYRVYNYLNRHIFKWHIEKPLVEELTNAPSPGRGFLTNSPPSGPTRWQMPDKCPGENEHAWNWLSHKGMKCMTKSYDRIARTTVLIYFFCYYWSSRTVILILKKMNLKVLYSVQFRNTKRWYPKINWNAVFFSSFWLPDSRTTQMDRSFKAF